MNGPSKPAPRGRVRRELIERLVRWSFLGGAEGDAEQEMLDSLSAAERRALKEELERLGTAIEALLGKLSSVDDDLYGGS